MSPDQMIMLLSEREREVLGEVACGYSHEAAGLRLRITKKTVDTHIANIRAKLGVRNTARMYQIAFAAGMGEPL